MSLNPELTADLMEDEQVPATATRRQRVLFAMGTSLVMLFEDLSQGFRFIGTVLLAFVLSAIVHKYGISTNLTLLDMTIALVVALELGNISWRLSKYLKSPLLTKARRKWAGAIRESHESTDQIRR